jgi:hypothetical protein
MLCAGNTSLLSWMGGHTAASLRIIGLYVPCAGSADADLGASITAQLEADTTDRDARPTLVAGDMNAALYPSDRTVGEESPRAYTHDRAHRAAMEGLRLAPVDALPTPNATHARLKTFRSQGKGLISRIDDVLTIVPKEELASMGGETGCKLTAWKGPALITTHSRSDCHGQPRHGAAAGPATAPKGPAHQAAQAAHVTRRC